MKKAKPGFAKRFMAEKAGKKFREKVQAPNAVVLEHVALKFLLVLTEARKADASISPKLEMAALALCDAAKACPTPPTMVTPTWITDFDRAVFEPLFGLKGTEVDAAAERLEAAARMVRFGGEIMASAGKLGIAEGFDSFAFNQVVERLRGAAREFEKVGT